VLSRSWPALAVLALVAAACGKPQIEVRSGGREEGFVPLVVDVEGLAGAGVSMATDADGNPHLSYLALPEQAVEGAPAPDPLAPTLPAVMHAHLVESIWTRGPVAEEQEVTEADETAITVDADGVHHVAWSAGGQVMYSSNVEGEFAEEPEAVGGTDAVGLSIAADDVGTPMIAFVDRLTEAEGPAALVRVARPSGDGWELETAAEASPDEPEATSIGVAGDSVLVAYGSDGATQVAREAGTRWTSEVVDEDGGLGVSMDVDADGVPRLAYYSAGGDVRVAQPAGDGWDTADVAAGARPNTQTSTAVDETGVQHVAWEEAQGIGYGTVEGTPGESQSLTEDLSASQGGTQPVVGTGPEGAVYVAWADPEDGELRLAIRSDQEPLLAVPSPEDGGGVAPVAQCEPEGTTLAIAAPPGAVTDGFDKDCLAVEAAQPYTIEFDNQDPGQLHNVNVYADDSATESLLLPPGEGTITGPDQTSYEGEPIEEAGEFFFRCDVHPTTMTGTFVVAGGQEGGGGASEGDGDGGGGGGGGGGG
jgi:hypothetical protein